LSIPLPAAPKIYHIVHVDRLPSIITEGGLLCDAEIVRRQATGQAMGTTIGMSDIKQRRLTRLSLDSHPGLFVGQCVPFYFCPRSIMLYLIHRANHEEMTYRGGQGPIVHLEADLARTVAWASGNNLRWAFTLSNAGAFYFEDRADLAQLGEIDWDAVHAPDWRGKKEGKQAEFLVEKSFPWDLVGRIGVKSQQIYEQVRGALQGVAHKPHVEIKSNWYY
jgi:hypothetical protein